MLKLQVWEQLAKCTLHDWNGFTAATVREPAGGWLGDQRDRQGWDCSRAETLPCAR